MDIFQQIRLSYLNRLVKLGISVFLALCTVLAAYIGYRGLFENEIGWIEASAYLLGILLPILVIGALLLFSSGGIEALQSRTSALLCENLPVFLKQIPDEGHRFRAASRPSPGAGSKNLAEVRIAHLRGRCYADYEIVVPAGDNSPEPKRFIIRVEVNVRKVNFNLYLPTHRLETLCEMPCDTSEFSERCNRIVRSAFGHTREGAQGRPVEGAAGYTFNERLIRRRLAGQDFHCLVGSLALTDDFLWNPAEKLFFCQDLMFMLRAFLAEQSDLFLTAASQGGAEPRRP